MSQASHFMAVAERWRHEEGFESPTTLDPVDPPQSLPRMLRVEVRGVLHDWFDIDDLGPFARTAAFAETLRENIARYFDVALEFQVLYDDDGLLTTPVELSRSLQRVDPLIYIYDFREMGSQLRTRTAEEFATINAQVQQFQSILGLLGDSKAKEVELNATLLPLSIDETRPPGDPRPVLSSSATTVTPSGRSVLSVTSAQKLQPDEKLREEPASPVFAPRPPRHSLPVMTSVPKTRVSSTSPALRACVGHNARAHEATQANTEVRSRAVAVQRVSDENHVAVPRREVRDVTPVRLPLTGVASFPEMQCAQVPIRSFGAGSESISFGNQGRQGFRRDVASARAGSARAGPVRVRAVSQGSVSRRRDPRALTPRPQTMRPEVQRFQNGPERRPCPPQAQQCHARTVTPPRLGRHSRSMASLELLNEVRTTPRLMNVRPSQSFVGLPLARGPLRGPTATASPAQPSQRL